MSFDLPRPEGDPGAARAYGRALMNTAARLGSTTEMVGAASSSLLIEGPFADRFHGRQADYRTNARRVADELHGLGVQVLRAAEELETAQAAWLRAKQRDDEASVQAARAQRRSP